MMKINKNMIKYMAKYDENVRQTWQRYMGGQCMMGAINAAREGEGFPLPVLLGWGSWNDDHFGRYDDRSDQYDHNHHYMIESSSLNSHPVSKDNHYHMINCHAGMRVMDSLIIIAILIHLMMMTMNIIFLLYHPSLQDNSSIGCCGSSLHDDHHYDHPDQ